MPEPNAAHPVAIVLDVARPEDATEFWTRRLGFRLVEITNEGLFTETRRLVSERWPGLAVVFRCCLPRPAAGSYVGSIRALVFPVPDLDAFVAGLGGDIRWVVPPPEDGSRASSVTLRDPSGYHLTFEARAGEARA